MKQNLKLSNFRRLQFTLVLLALTLATLACATRARDSSSATQSSSASLAPQRASLVNINSASAQELEKLPGVGKVIAERIVMLREQNGPFRRAEHLMMVRGISDRKFRDIRSTIIAE